jgi:hypothetical protein
VGFVTFRWLCGVSLHCHGVSGGFLAGMWFLVVVLVVFGSFYGIFHQLLSLLATFLSICGVIWRDLVVPAIFQQVLVTSGLRWVCWRRLLLFSSALACLLVPMLNKDSRSLILAICWLLFWSLTYSLAYGIVWNPYPF